MPHTAGKVGRSVWLAGYSTLGETRFSRLPLGRPLAELAAHFLLAWPPIMRLETSARLKYMEGNMSVDNRGARTGAVGNPARGLQGSIIVYLAMMAFLVLTKVVVDAYFPDVFRAAGQAQVFEWPALAIWTAAGLVGVVLAERTGFPSALDERVSNSQRFLIPIAIGLAFGGVYVVHDLLTGASRVLTAYYGQPSVNIAFPASGLIYTSGAIISEVLFRLLPVPLLLWLISNLALGGRLQNQTFWVLAVVSSLLEPLMQTPPLLTAGVALFASVFAMGFAFNLAQAAIFRQYGFLASIVMRVAFYVVWHILYVH
jgi:hypothetical protein